MLKVIDAHVHYHVFVKKIPEHCKEFLANVEGTRFTTKNDEVEIEKVLLVPSHPCYTEECYDGFYIDYEERRRNPDLYLQWGKVNPLTCNVKEELERQYSLGIIGIKLHPVHHAFKPNAYREEEGGLKSLLYIYEFAEDHDLPVMIHTGTSTGVKSRNKYGDPILVDDVAKDFPRIKIILAHAGRPIWYSTAFYMARFMDNVYLEISSIPPKNILKVLPRLKEISDKVIYGSDFPAFKGQDLAEYALQVYNEVKDEKIMRDNAKRILKI
ncbi:amidohydrolase family protein [Acidianus sp. HS-5]|uniref:amidohydrolase family protein n=1 Tax=Acidianus sp. HS-5 TaxID=2886040 RepID=UPI001F268C20|nr:amidohydrolase family protein [Acidianus sp. HS-5]BDC18819.1 amidohydrolase [Acidianus sp. HS-5]